MTTQASHGNNVDRVHAALREKILSGAYPPGSRLILSRLAEDHEISFIPVREALQRLEAERMIRIEPNRGATVTEISIDDMADIYETRLVLEAYALSSAVARISPTQLRQTEAALEDMRSGFQDGDDVRAYEAHEHFHFSLYNTSESVWTVHLIRQLWSSAERYVRLAASVRPDPDLFVAEHEKILAAVKRKDAASAVARLTYNLRTTKRLLAGAYEERECVVGSSESQTADLSFHS